MRTGRRRRLRTNSFLALQRNECGSTGFFIGRKGMGIRDWVCSKTEPYPSPEPKT